MSPALAGRFSTSAPPGKPLTSVFMMVPARVWLAADVLPQTGPADTRNEEREQLAEIQLRNLEQAFLSCLVFPLDLPVGLFLKSLYFFTVPGNVESGHEGKRGPSGEPA